MTPGEKEERDSWAWSAFPQPGRVLPGNSRARNRSRSRRRRAWKAPTKLNALLWRICDRLAV